MNTARRDIEELLLRLSEFGHFISSAMTEAAGSSEMIDNVSIMVLVTLDLEGPQRPSDLKDRTGLSSGGVTKAVDRLEQRDLVERAYGVIPEDHRGVVVSLTDEGRRFVGTITAALAEHLPESKTLVEELDRLLGN